MYIYLPQQRVVRGDSYLKSMMATESLISSIWLVVRTYNLCLIVLNSLDALDTLCVIIQTQCNNSKIKVGLRPA